MLLLQSLLARDLSRLCGRLLQMCSGDDLLHLHSRLWIGSVLQGVDDVRCGRICGGG